MTKATICLLSSLLLLPAASAELPPAGPGGWIDLTPDASFTGWTRVPIPGASVIKPYNQWSVSGKTIICKGDGEHEWLRFDEPLADFVLSLEWKATPRKGTYNGGVGVRMSPYVEIWHQAQTKPDGGYLFGNTFLNGKLQRISLKSEMTENRIKPAGQWNAYEIRAQGGTISLSVNGRLVSVWKHCQVLQGYIGLEAERYPIEYRNLRLKKLD